MDGQLWLDVKEPHRRVRECLESIRAPICRMLTYETRFSAGKTALPREHTKRIAEAITKLAYAFDELERLLPENARKERT